MRRIAHVDGHVGIPIKSQQIVGETLVTYFGYLKSIDYYSGEMTVSIDTISTEPAAGKVTP